MRIAKFALVPAVKTVLLAGITIAVLLLRRPDQFASPYVFIEDGFILRDFADRGVLAIFGTVHGLPALSARILSISAYKISILQAPAIGVALTAAFTCFVVLAIAFSPTHLRARSVCAVVPLLIPIGAEVYAVPVMTVWWAGLLLFLALLWRDNGNQLVRIAFILIGGLSNPVVLALAPLFVWRALLDKRLAEWTTAGVATLCAAITLFTLLMYGPTTAITPTHPTSIVLAIGKFIGWFTSSAFLSDQGALLAWGILMLAVFLSLIYAARHTIDRYFVLLVFAFLAVCVATALRVPVEAPHPFFAGPRYFFFQFITIGWLTIWIMVITQGWTRLVAAFVLAVAIIQGLTNFAFRWRHERWNWQQHIRDCAASESYVLPIHYHGGNANPPILAPHITWSITLTGEQCRRMLASSLFARAGTAGQEQWARDRQFAD